MKVNWTKVIVLEVISGQLTHTVKDIDEKGGRRNCQGGSRHCLNNSNAEVI